MERDFFCPDCRASHDTPATAQLGLRVVCIDCALAIEIIAIAAATPEPGQLVLERVERAA